MMIPNEFKVETRLCIDCVNAKQLWDGWICKKHLIALSKKMYVTYEIREGSCWINPRESKTPTTKETESDNP